MLLRRAGILAECWPESNRYERVLEPAVGARHAGDPAIARMAGSYVAGSYVAGSNVAGVKKSPAPLQGGRTFLLAEWTGLEPATPGVTGRYSNQLNYHSKSGGC